MKLKTSALIVCITIVIHLILILYGLYPGLGYSSTYFVLCQVINIVQAIAFAYFFYLFYKKIQ